MKMIKTILNAVIMFLLILSAFSISQLITGVVINKEVWGVIMLISGVLLFSMAKIDSDD
jgi:hypothetical protein